MSRRLVVFDVDGTLVDSQAHILAAMTQAFGALGLQTPPRAEVLGIVGLSLPEAISHLAPWLTQAEQTSLVTSYKQAFSELRATALSPLYPGAKQALEQLSHQDGIVFGIATGKSRRGLDAILQAHGWSRRFATVQVADDHPSKPHPSMLLSCLKETGIDACHTVMVGDTRYDMEMARAAGVHGLGVAWGYHPATMLGARVIDEFSALPAALQQIWEGTVK